MNGLVRKLMVQSGVKDAATVIFILFFAVVLIESTFNHIKVIHAPFSYQLTEWAIDYSAGFIRRGLAGEIIYNLSELTGFNFKNLVAGFLVVTNSIFLIVAAVIAYPLRYNLAAWLLIYTPFSLAAPALNSDLGGHKDPVAMAIIGICIFGASVKKGWVQSLSIVSAFFLFIPLSFMHEGYIIYIPIMIGALFLADLSKSALSSIVISIALTATTVAICSAYSGTIDQREQIVEAFSLKVATIERMRPLDEYVAFFFIGQDFPSAIEYVSGRTMIGIRELPAALALTAGVLLLSIKCFWGVMFPAQQQLRVVISAIACSLILNLMIFLIALDWVRFLYLHFCSSALLLMAAANKINAFSSHIMEGTIASNRLRRAAAWSIIAGLALLPVGKVAPNIVDFKIGDALGVALIFFAVWQAGKERQ